jgi:hypothetical protein
LTHNLYSSLMLETKFHTNTKQLTTMF